MGRCQSVIIEVRFIFEDGLTQVYVLSNAIGDCPIGVQGWHHKTFPASMDALTIMKEEIANYLDWGLQAP